MYVEAADFREKSLKPWTQGTLLSEADGTDVYLALVIAQVQGRVELDLGDDFEPANPDDDEVLELDSYGRSRLYVPRRVRALTTVKTRANDGTLTTQTAANYRLHKSLNAAGTAMIVAADGNTSRLDWLDVIQSLDTVGTLWPEGPQTVQLTGKFGWAAVPEDIKRLVALRVYGLVKAKADPLTTITQRTTADAIITYGPSAEETDIVRRYTRLLTTGVG